MKKIPFFISLALFSSLSFSDCNSTICKDVLIETIEINSNNDVYVSTSADEAGLICDTINGAIRMKSSTPAYKEIYAILLSAQKSESAVDIFVDEIEYDCELKKIKSKQ